MQLAIFDIDGTLVRYSTERAFGRYLLRRGLLGPRQVGSFLAFGLRSLPVARAQTLKVNKAYLAGLELEAIERLARSFVADEACRQFVAPVAARLAQHRARGDHVVLQSGTLDAIACSLADTVGAHGALGTTCAIKDGRFRAAPPLRHPFGAEKREQAQRLAAEFSLPPENIVAYANSIHDLDLLEFAGRPVAVRPDRALRRIALEKGWEIIDDELYAGLRTRSANTR